MDFLTNISLDGFKVVQGQCFERQAEIAMTIRKTNISFSIPAHKALNDCEMIQILVNAPKRNIVVMPTNSNDPNAIRWRKHEKNKSVSWIFCSMFCNQIFRDWGWNEDLRYKAKGRIVTSDSKVMLLFDFNNAESYRKQEREKKNA